MSHKLNETVIVYESVVTPGYVYKFFRVKDNEYRCCRCKELGKYRSVRIVDDSIVGRKDREQDHHLDCAPTPESSVLATEVDREMRSEVRKHGKRPRDAYNEMLGNIAKRFKTSQQQV